MSDPITDLQISTSEEEEQQLKAENFKKIPDNLNIGTSGAAVYLWYKTDGQTKVTRIQFSIRPDMDDAFSAAGFTCVRKNLNKGTKGDPIYLWYMSGTAFFDLPIINLKVTTNVQAEPALFKSGWERLGCDLNRNAGGKPVYLWVKRSGPTNISSIKATTHFSEDTALFQPGYLRVDEDTNRGAQPAGSPVFIWYQHSKDVSDVINKISISLNAEDEKRLQSEGFIKVDTNLNEGTRGNPVYLWYKRGQTSTVQYFTVLVGDEARRTYTAANCKVLEKNLNNENGGVPLYVAYTES